MNDAPNPYFEPGVVHRELLDFGPDGVTRTTETMSTEEWLNRIHEPFLYHDPGEPAGYFPSRRSGIVRGARILVRREGEPDLVMIVDDVQPTGPDSFTLDWHPAGDDE